MNDVPADPPISHPTRPWGAGLFTLGGFAAAFGLAACCALPLMLTTFGLGTAWLATVGLIAEPHRQALLLFGAVALAGGAILLAREQYVATTCAPGTVCASRVARISTLVGLLIGAVLLWAGYAYA